MKLFHLSRQYAVHHHPDSAALEIAGLSFKYDGNLVLQEINLSITRGQRVAVVGPNGAGKSTLFKVIAGVLPYSSGKVNVYGAKPGGHICIAYLPQRSQVDWNFPVSVADVVMMGRIGMIGFLRQPNSRDWQVVYRCLETVHMKDLAERQISELSGGQQQRMFIARALAQEAELVLMDEPLNGLDITSQEIIFAILDEMRQRSVTVLVATHDLNMASERFDKVLLLNRRLVGFGLAQDVLNASNLLDAYGGHLRMVQTEAGIVALGDTCCEE